MLAASIMQILKSLTLPWKLYTTVLQFPPCGDLRMCVLACKCESICVGKRGERRECERGRECEPVFSFLRHYYTMTINPTAVCLLCFRSPVCKSCCSHSRRSHAAACHSLHLPYVLTAGHASLSHYSLCPLLLQHD